MDTRRVDEYLKRLRKQVDFLEERLAGKEEDKSHYARAELIALKWIISYVEDTPLEAAEHQHKWFNERVRIDD